LHRVVEDAVAALARDTAVFQRGGSLVHVIREPRPSRAIRRAPGSPIIRSIPQATIREMLTRVASWERYDRRIEEWVAAMPSDDVVQAVAMRGEWPNIRPLIGITEAPCLRPDGTVLQSPGYDPITGYLYAPNANYPRISNTPSAHDALEARNQLLEVCCDFPFAGEAHRAAWLALLLTLFARPAIDGCVPLFAIDATTRGSGKGRLADATAVIATGRDATKTAQPSNDDEMRKRITTLIVEGEAVTVLDNLARPLGDPSLDAALTATSWKDRALGRTASVSAQNTLVWIATGNNIELGADTARRTLHIRLESPLENPEDRASEEFRHPDLLGWVRAERPQLVQAAVTLLRGYFHAGCPDSGARPWGSFEAWSRLIPNVVAWVGLPDPTTTRQDFESSADGTKRALTALLDGWARLDPGEGLTAKAAITALYPSTPHESRPPDGFDSLREAIEELVPTQPGKSPSPAQLSYQLRKNRHRVIGGRYLESQIAHGGVCRWRVVTQVNRGGSGGVGGDGGVVSARPPKDADLDPPGTGQNCPTIPTIPTVEVHLREPGEGG
jgi:hypothetical protein